MSIRLEVDDGDSVRTVETARNDVTVGRARTVDLRLDCGGMSRRHARLRVVGDALEITDLGSKNGVHVHGAPTERAMLSVGDSFEIGSAFVTVVALAAPVTAPRPAAGSAMGHIHHRGPRAPDFDELLWAALRKTPWYLSSIALHAACFLALTVVDLGLSAPPTTPRDVTVALAGGTQVDALDEQTKELLVDDALDDLRRKIQDDLADDPLHFDPVMADDPEDEDPLADPSVVLERNAAPFGSLEMGNAALGISQTGPAGMPLGRNFGKDEAGNANAFAARQLRASPFSRRLLEGLRLKSDAIKVRVLGGEYDQCEDVLHRLGLEHDILLPGEVDLAPLGPEISAVFYNCTSKPLTPRALNHIERFVHRGGYLFTTDWGLENVLEPRFSNYVRTLRRRGRVIMTDDEVISFEAVASHPLLRGLPGGREESRWWLENSSVLVDIVDEHAVEVLVESADLERRHGSRVVAVTFAHGRGRVVHVLGHFFQKEGNLRGTVSMQRILLNFLHQALRSR